MNDQDLISAKATRPEEQSEAIVVSFGAEWQEHLLAKDFSVVIRKRVPKAATFKWLYFHINAPVSAICARAPIVKISTETTTHALALAKKINLSPTEISSYIGTDTTIGCYTLGSFQFAPKPISISDLSARMVYHPPQSFFILSKEAKRIVDQLAAFTTTKSQPRKTTNL